MLKKRFADNTSRDSVSTRLRRQRFTILVKLLDYFEGPVRILDVGGRPQFWESMTADRILGKSIHVTLLNLEAYPVCAPGFTAVVGDGRKMPQYLDGQFDIVFSNSTIEHAGTRADQLQMANEMRRVGKAYCIQTPSRSFPIEPHFLFPFFQFLPISVRTRLVNTFDLGWYKRVRDKREAEALVRSISLLSRRDVERLFPDATIYEERYAGAVKSYVAYRGASHSGVPAASTRIDAPDLEFAGYQLQAAREDDLKMTSPRSGPARAG